MNLSEQGAKEFFQQKVTIWTVIFCVAFTVILGRVWHLQIFNGKRWRVFSEANRIEIKTVPATRGRILDRDGRVLSESRPSFDLVAIPSKLLGTPDKVVRSLGTLLAWDEKQVAQRIRMFNNARPNEPLVLKRDLIYDDMVRFSAQQVYYTGVEVVDTPARTYPRGTFASHLLGYLGEIGKKDLEKLKGNPNSRHRRGEFWGLSGVERKFEFELKGVNGSTPVVEDARGRELGEEHDDLLPEFQKQLPVPGNDLRLSLDARLQEVLEASFTHESGAAVAMNANNGDVLAILAKPQFLPEKFARGVSSEYWRELRAHEKNPMYDRSVRGLYPPGSTFKMVTAAAALEEKVIDTEEKIFCPGHYRLGRETKRCWKRGGHGWMDMKHAIKHSCDVYFYEVGRRLGIDAIAKYAREFGLGERIGIGMNNESRGLVPSKQWKEKVYKQPWVGGETLSVAIGQGFLQTTPLQMAVATMSLVNGGRILQPRLVLTSQNNAGVIEKEYPVVEKQRMNIDPETLKIVREGMAAVVNEPGGTAYWSGRSQLISIAGKTGTAQVVSLRAAKQIKDHAWFIAYAPVENPEIVVSVIVENGGHGGSTAAPIAKKVIEEYAKHYVPREDTEIL